jgi:hypothetical protein
MTTWRKGPPPSIGWWPASVCREPRSLRWWDGSRWSITAYSDMTAMEASWRAKAKQPEIWENNIEWTDRPAWWPERSKT